MNEKELLPLLSAERFRVTEDSVEMDDAVEVAGMSFAVRVAMMTLGVWFGLMMLAAAYGVWQEGAYAGAAVVVLAGLAAGVGAATWLWRRERVTLDEAGLRWTWIVVGVPAWRWKYPLERVREFRAWTHTDGALGGERIMARVVTPAGKRRDVRLTTLGGQREQAVWMAEQLNTVLGRLKTRAGLPWNAEEETPEDRK